MIKQVFYNIYKRKWLFFLLFTLIVWIEYYALGPFSYYIKGDTGNANLPFYIRLKEFFFVFRPTYWFPYLVCGVDRLSDNIHFSDFVSFFYFIMPSWMAYASVVLIQRFLVGYFTYKISRKYLNLSDTSSVFAGILCSITTHDLFVLQLGLMGFPLFLYLLERLDSNNRRLNWIIIGIFSIFVSFSSFLSITLPFACVLSFLWFIIVRQKYDLIFYGKLTLFWTIVFALQFPTIQSLLLNGAASQRSDWTASVFENIGLYHKTFSFFYSFPYALALILGGFLVSKGRSGLFWRLFIMTLICSLGAYIAQMTKYYLMSFDVPTFIRSFNFYRIWLFTEIFAAFLLAHCLDLIHQWLKQKKPLLSLRWLRSQPINTFSLVLCFTYVFVGWFLIKAKIASAKEWVIHGSQQKNYQSPVLKDLAQKTKDERFRIATARSGLFPNYNIVYGFEAVDGYLAIYSKSYKNYWAKVIEPLAKSPQETGPAASFMDWGNTVYLFNATVLPDDGVVDFDKRYKIELLSLINTKYIFSQLHLKGKHLKPVLEQDRKWLLIPDKEKALMNIKQNFSGRTFVNIYENTQVLPRYFLVRNVKTFKDSRNLFDALGEAEFQTLQNNIFIEEKYLTDMVLKEGRFSRYQLTEDVYSPDLIKLTVESDGSGYLFVSNNYSPYWQCMVNGVRQKIIPAYGTFWVVALKEGKSNVKFIYNPPYKFAKFKN